MSKVIKLVLVLILAFVAVACKTTTHDKEAITQAVLEANTKITTAANALDADTMFASIVETDQRLIIQDGRLLPRASKAKERVQRGFDAVETLERTFDHTEVTILSADIALLTGTGTSNIAFKNGQKLSTPFAVSNVFVLRNGKWMILQGHYSVPNPR
jgi:SnoaL-like domain